MNLLINFCIISYLLVITAATEKPSFASSKGYAAFSEWKVTVINQLSPGKTLFLRCKSKDDDLGDQILQVGQSFSWEFKVNFFATTLFWCKMRTSSNKHVAMEVFWPERQDWLGYRCDYGLCNWNAKDNGIYLENINEKSMEFVRNWEN